MPPPHRADCKVLIANIRHGSAPMRKKHIVVLIGAVVIILASGALVLKHVWPSRDAEAANSAPPPAPVVAGTVAQHDVPIYLNGVGTVIAYNTVVVHAQIQGQITSINF